MASSNEHVTFIENRILSIQEVLGFLQINGRLTNGVSEGFVVANGLMTGNTLSINTLSPYELTDTMLNIISFLVIQ